MELTEQDVGKAITCTMTGVTGVVYTYIEGAIWYKMDSNGTTCKYTDLEKDRWDIND